MIATGDPVLDMLFCIVNKYTELCTEIQEHI